MKHDTKVRIVGQLVQGACSCSWSGPRYDRAEDYEGAMGAAREDNKAHLAEVAA
jgi:hypothetical protein